MKREKYDPCMLRAPYDEVFIYIQVYSFDYLYMDSKVVAHFLQLLYMFFSSFFTIWFIPFFWHFRDRTLGLQPVPDTQDVYVLNSGLAPMFSRSEKKQLIDHLSYMPSIGYGYSKKEFLHLATDFAIS